MTTSQRYEIPVTRSSVLAAFAARKSVRDMGLYVLEQSDDRRLGRMIFEDATDWGVGLALQAFFRFARAQWGKVPSRFVVVVEPRKGSASAVSIEVACQGGQVARFAA